MTVLMATVLMTSPAFAWNADLGVAVTGSKDIPDEEVSFTVTVTNGSGDGAINVVLSIIIADDNPFLGYTSSDFTCTLDSNVSGASYSVAVCTRATTCGTSCSYDVTVTLDNPGNPNVTAEAQVMSIVPDHDTCDNYDLFTAT